MAMLATARGDWSETDVTPFFEYRRFSGARGQLQWLYDEGVMSASRRGATFVNWHEDHYREGVARNDQTRRRFKRVARILKNVKCQMVASDAPEGRAAAEKVPSFLIECLAFNAPDSCFNLQPSAYVEDVKAVIGTFHPVAECAPASKQLSPAPRWWSSGRPLRTHSTPPRIGRRRRRPFVAVGSLTRTRARHAVPPLTRMF
jgi:hypothetical protein